MSAYSTKKSARIASLNSFADLKVAPVDMSFVSDLMADFVGQDKIEAKKEYDLLRTEAFRLIDLSKASVSKSEYYQSSAKSLLNQINDNYDLWKKESADLAQIARAGNFLHEFYSKAREAIHDLLIGDEAYAEFVGDLADFREVHGQDKNLVDLLFFYAQNDLDVADEHRANARILFANADGKLVEAGLSSIIEEREAARKAAKAKK